VIVRPLTLPDAAAFRAFVARLSPASRYQRFQGALKELSPQLLRQLLVADPRSHVALGAFNGEEMVGEARYVRCENPLAADFAIAVDDDWRRRGVAHELMEQLLQRARRDGLERLEGEVLADNKAMLGFAAQSGFRMSPHPEDERLVRVTREISRPPRAAHVVPMSAVEPRFLHFI
jgi:acetyltransferase